MITAAAVGAVVPLAKSGEALKAGPIGLVVILLLCISSYFLFKSMSRHMRNVREKFPEDEHPQTPQRPLRPQRPVAPRRPSRAELRAAAARSDSHHAEHSGDQRDSP